MTAETFPEFYQRTTGNPLPDDVALRTLAEWVDQRIASTASKANPPKRERIA